MYSRLSTRWCCSRITHKFAPWHPEVIRQLPRDLMELFPAIILRRSAVDKRLIVRIEQARAQQIGLKTLADNLKESHLEYFHGMQRRLVTLLSPYCPNAFCPGNPSREKGAREHFWQDYDADKISTHTTEPCFRFFFVSPLPTSLPLSRVVQHEPKKMPVSFFQAKGTPSNI